MKVEVETLINFNMAAAKSNKTQLEVTAEASKDVLKKISAKLKPKK